MRELVNAITRFSVAVTIFGLQQLENAAGAITDSDVYLSRFRESLDAVTNAITAQLDQDAKPTLDSVTHLSADLVDRTMETLKTPALDPRQMIKTASDVIRKTAASLSTSAGEPKTAKESTANTPQRAVDALPGQ